MPERASLRSGMWSSRLAAVAITLPSVGAVGSYSLVNVIDGGSCSQVRPAAVTSVTVTV